MELCRLSCMMSAAAEAAAGGELCRGHPSLFCAMVVVSAQQRQASGFVLPVVSMVMKTSPEQAGLNTCSGVAETRSYQYQSCRVDVLM